MRAKLKSKRIWFDTIGSSLADDADQGERPTILALHGGPGIDHSSVEPTVTPLADLGQILLIDQCGHGRSDYGYADDWTIEAWASDIAEPRQWRAAFTGSSRPRWQHWISFQMPATFCIETTQNTHTKYPGHSSQNRPEPATDTANQHLESLRRSMRPAKSTAPNPVSHRPRAPHVGPYRAPGNRVDERATVEAHVVGGLARSCPQRAAVRLPACPSRCPLWPTTHQVEEAGLQRRVIGDISR